MSKKAYGFEHRRLSQRRGNLRGGAGAGDQGSCCVATRRSHEGAENLQEQNGLVLKTSRTQVDRLLDPKNDITLMSLQRAAAMVGRRVSIELV